MHAAARLPGYVGRVHEVRRSQPRLSGPLILEFGVSSPPRASPESSLCPLPHLASHRVACVVSRTHMWEHGQFQSWHGIDYLLLALTGWNPG